MDEKLVDIRVQFKPTSGNLFDSKKVLPNELVMRVQPDEAIYLRCMTKSPGKPELQRPHSLDPKPETKAAQTPQKSTLPQPQPLDSLSLSETPKPGLNSDVVPVEMDLTYKKHFVGSTDLPDAYERLILDALNGDSSLFVREDELAASWRIFTPVSTLPCPRLTS